MSRWPDLYSKEIVKTLPKALEMPVPGPIDIEAHPGQADAQIGRFIMIQAIEKAYEDHSLSY